MMVEALREQTFTSPFARSVVPARYGDDSWYQHDLLKRSWASFFEDPFEHNVDLRGRTFEVQVHDDGLHVTVRES